MLEKRIKILDDTGDKLNEGEVALEKNLQSTHPLDIVKSMTVRKVRLSGVLRELGFAPEIELLREP